MKKQSECVKINWKIGLDRSIICGLLSGILIGKFVYDGYRDGMKAIGQDIVHDTGIKTLIINQIKEC